VTASHAKIAGTTGFPNSLKGQPSATFPQLHGELSLAASLQLARDVANAKAEINILVLSGFAHAFRY
jgi:hypothetical protein